MTPELDYEVIIIGAGHCGVALAYHLQKKNISYIILEKDRAFSSWYKKWDTFYMNTANWMNLLPGTQGDSLINKYNRSSKQQMIEQFEKWVELVSPNIKISNVEKVGLADSIWIVTTGEKQIRARRVVFAVGLNTEFIPHLHFKIPKSTPQIHSSDYRNPKKIVTKNVIIVGTGSSGIQICEELAKGKRHSIVLCCSRNRRFRWKIFGVPIYRIAKVSHIFDIRSKSYLGKLVKLLFLSRGDPATPPSPRQLHMTYNVELKGKLKDIKKNMAIFENGVSVNLNDTTIIWCTGYRVDLASMIDTKLHYKLLDDNGCPILRSEFQSPLDGIYFLGLRFQRTLSSHIIYGAVRDAEVLAQLIQESSLRSL